MAVKPSPHPHRGEPAVYEVLSRHATSEGIVMWTRRANGALELRLHRYGREEDAVVARGRQPRPRAAA